MLEPVVFKKTDPNSGTVRYMPGVRKSGKGLIRYVPLQMSLARATKCADEMVAELQR